MKSRTEEASGLAELEKAQVYPTEVFYQVTWTIYATAPYVRQFIFIVLALKVAYRDNFTPFHIFLITWLVGSQVWRRDTNEGSGKSSQHNENYPYVKKWEVQKTKGKREKQKINSYGYNSDINMFLSLFFSLSLKLYFYTKRLTYCNADISIKHQCFRGLCSPSARVFVQTWPFPYFSISWKKLNEMSSPQFF